MSTTLTPYLHFNGNCEEALNAYKAIFGGSINAVQRYEMMNPNAPPEQKDKILHAELKFDGCSFFASDSFGDRAGVKARPTRPYRFRTITRRRPSRFLTNWPKAERWVCHSRNSFGARGMAIWWIDMGSIG